MAEEPADVFAFPDLSLSTRWLAVPFEPRHDIFGLDVIADSNGQTNRHITNPPSSHTASNNDFFKIPHGLTLPDLERQDQADDEPNEPAELLHNVTLPDFDIDELWHIGTGPPTAHTECKTWEASQCSDVPKSAPLFITEAGTAVYDAALADRDDPLHLGGIDQLVVQSNLYPAVLLALAVGRGSAFFIWDAKKAAFVPAEGKMRISGFSGEVIQGLQRSCLISGTTTRFLSSYVQLTYRTRPCPAKVVLAKAVDILLLAIQQQLGERGKELRSLLQLQPLVEPLELMLSYLRDLVQAVSRMRADDQVLSHIFSQTEILENEHFLLRAVMCEVLSKVTESWTDFAEKWIGVKAENGILLTDDGLGKSFVKIQKVTRVDDLGSEFERREYVFDEIRMPNFIPPDIALAMFETGKTLRLLRTYYPQHPLCHSGVVVSCDPPTLKWLFDWESIENLQNEVHRYEKAMLRKINERSPAVNFRFKHEDRAAPRERGMLEVFTNGGRHLEQQLIASIEALDKARPPADTQDVLSSILQKCLYREGDHFRTNAPAFGLHWSLIPSHSFGPLVMSQARLINREYMKLLFNGHGLREHLRVQKEFQLLGNGMFCSRLSHALFDPDLETAERQTGVALNGGTMGLRMNGRETWPPASSELRLALMDILSDAYQPPRHREATPSRGNNSSLPGNLSFGLRDLVPEEIDRCMDPTSLEALDFLRLTYKTPDPLSPIITTETLDKYDRVFKLLLRILRMLYVVGQLSRDTTKMERQGRDTSNTWLRFRFEAQHVVQSVANYFLDTGVQIPWLQFERWLDRAESDLTQVDTDASAARAVSPDEVRGEHEKTLDRIMTILLLRKRQQPVLTLLEDIFRLILRFSRQVQLEVGGKVAGNASKVIIQELYQIFRNKMNVFVTVCHGMKERGDGGTPASWDDKRSGDGVGDGNTIDRLLAVLGDYSWSEL